MGAAVVVTFFRFAQVLCVCARSLSRARRRASSSRVGVCCVLVSRRIFLCCFVSKRSLFYFPERKKRDHILRLKKKNQTNDTRMSSPSSSSAAAACTLKVRTRAQKRRMGERDVWDLIVNNDDITFIHILPRLNANDVKFLYGVNSETRKLIKRSSRASDLKEKFKVSEMSSVSTLEVAWEHYPWGTLKYGVIHDEKWFCRRVARTNKLELLKWIREEKKCEWNDWTINAAAYQGNLEMVKYCVANKCPIGTALRDAGACANAAENGQLECLKYLREEAKAPWDWRTASYAARNGHLHILEYLVERKYDKYDEVPCRWAAMNGHLDCLKYLHETAKAPWDEDAVREAHENNHPDCVQYLLDTNCPLPPGWRYEGGTLYDEFYQSVGLRER